MAPDKNYRDTERLHKKNGKNLSGQSQLLAHKIRAGKLDPAVVVKAANLGFTPACAMLGRPFNNEVLAATLANAGKAFCIKWAILVCERVIHLWTNYINMPWSSNPVGEVLRIELQPVLSMPNRALDIAIAYSNKTASLDDVYRASQSLANVQEAVQRSLPQHPNLKLWDHAEPALQVCRAIRQLLTLCLEPWRRQNLTLGKKNVVIFTILCHETAINASMARHNWERSYAEERLLEEIVPVIIPDLLE